MADGALDPVALLAALTEHGVDFVLIGALAVSVHGEVRGTADLDIMAPAGDASNKAALAAALEALDARVLPADAGGAEPDPEDPYPTVTFSTRHGKLDVLYRPDGSAPYKKVKERAMTSAIGGQSVRVASKNDMISMKLAAGRPHDLTDVANMTAAELAEPSTVAASMRLRPQVNEAWAVEYTRSRLGLFDPNGRVWVDDGHLNLEARRRDLTAEQLRYWAKALAERLHGAELITEDEPAVQITPVA